MSTILRFSLVALATAGFVLPTATVCAQQTKGSATGKAAAAPAKPSAADQAKLNEVLATVNGDKITRGQLLQILSNYPVGPGNEKTFYTTAMDMLVNARLLTQFLNSRKIKVDDGEIEKILDQQRAAVKQEGTSLESALAEAGLTLDQVKEQIRETRQWNIYVDQMATDAVLGDYMKANPDVFNGTAVRASHIQLNVDEKAPAAEKQKAREKLVSLKKDIVAGKITFADAANKYSEDPTIKEQPSGGDLKWFARKRFTEPFSAAAFALKKGEISDPVETEYGVHLIQVTDRREGKMPTLEMVKEKAKSFYANDEQTRIIAAMRDKAKIDIKPMPTDLFPGQPPATKPADAAKAGSAKPGAAKS